MLPLMCKVVRVHIKKVFLKGAYAWGKYVLRKFSEAGSFFGRL